jgi:hypothetical protein
VAFEGLQIREIIKSNQSAFARGLQRKPQQNQWGASSLGSASDFKDLVLMAPVQERLDQV